MALKNKKKSLKPKKPKSKNKKPAIKKAKKEFEAQKSLRSAAIIISAFLLGFSFFYYYVLFLPSIEKQKLEQQKQLQEFYLKNQETEKQNEPVLKTEEVGTEELSDGLLSLDCSKIAKQTYLEIFELGIENCNKKTGEKEKSDCVTFLISDLQKGMEEAEKECLKEDLKDSGGLNIIIP